MRELRITVLGNVDAGKSSLTGVLTKNVLDDGRGYARSLVSQFSHEKNSGKTSSVTQNFSKNEDGSNASEIKLNPGDLCLYRGCDLYHWRPPFTQRWYLQSFLH